MKQNLSPGATCLLEYLKSLNALSPSFHVVLGSGFKDALASAMPKDYQVIGELAFADVPGLHPSTAPGHSGKFIILQNIQSKATGIIQVGRLHGYEGLEAREVVRPVMYSRELGCETFFVTNAAGGIDSAHRPGDVMIIEDHINLTGRTPLLGENPARENGEAWGPRFPDLTKLYDRNLRSKMKEALLAERLSVHQGVYMGVLGPSYETPAEVRFFRLCGTHAVGMSTVWETIALKHSGAKVFGLSLISNVAAGLAESADGELEELDHFSILDVCKVSSVHILKAILLVAGQLNS